MPRFIYPLIILTLLLVQNIQAQSNKADLLLDSIFSLDANPQIDDLFDILDRLNKLSIKENNKNALAYSLNGKTSAYYAIKDFALFELALEEFMEVAKDTTELGLYHYSNALSCYATLYDVKGNQKKSIENELQAIELAKRIPNNYKELAILHKNISTDYRLIGDYQSALKNAFKALELLEKEFKSKKENELSFVKYFLQIVYSLRDMGRTTEALYWIEKGMRLELQSKKNQTNEEYDIYTIELYLNRVLINLKINSLVDVYEDISKILEIQKNTKHRIYYLHELQGEYYRKTSNQKKAITSFNYALQDALKVYSDNQEYPALPRIYKRRATSYIALDSLNAAFDDLQKGLQYFDANLEDNWSSNPDINISNAAPVGLDLLTTKATLAKDQFLTTSDTLYLSIARNTYRSAMNLVDNMRLSYINEGSKYYIVEEAQSIYKAYIDLLLSAKEFIPKDRWTEDVYNTIQRTKNAVLVERIKEKVALLSSDIPKELKDKESKLRSDISFYSKLISEIDTNDSTSIAKKSLYEDQLFKAKENFTIFDNKLKSKYPEYYALANAPKKYYNLNQIRDKLTANEAIIEYFETDNGFVTITIKNSDVQIHNIENNDVSNQLIHYISTLSQSPSQSGVSISELSTKAEQLYAILLGGIINLDQISQLHIIPDGITSKLPFATLINPQSKAYLLSDKSISYYVAIGQFMNNTGKPKESNSILGISPSFDTSDDIVDCQCNGSELTDLTYAPDELTYLQSIYDGNYLKDLEATKASFIENSKDFAIVHLATHACLNETDPMLSQIFFSDGSLTNYDLQNLNIHPELVVLAACNTAQGEIQQGEGVISLSRGFFEAGVKSLVSSLWSIDDYSSSEIITGMYTHLKKGSSKAQALRQAKLDYLKSADKLRSHPYYWAGLIQIGDNNPIHSSWNWTWPIVIGSFILLLVLLILIIKNKGK